jgi:predicted outer membrane repeat protein
MKTKSLLPISGLYVLILLLMMGLVVQSQIQFQGLAIDNEGTAAWDADGTGPEPLATGHNVPLPGFTNQPYYGSSRDYIDSSPDAAGFHLLDGISGFPLFSQALTDYGFSPDQVKVKFNLCTLADDVEGIDWLIMEEMYYANYYNLEYSFELDDELMISGFIGYTNYSINVNGDLWYGECSFTKPINASSASSLEVQEVANAFLQDLGGEEMYLSYNLSTEQFFSGNGRTGRYMNITNGILDKGLPSIPFQGLEDNNEGVAFWDTDGTGDEPLRNGHSNFLYYSASVDYDDLNPDPNAAFCHILEGCEGFTNFILQLEYRGYSMDQVKIKSGISDLDEDKEGEDWFGEDTLNYYHSLMTIEINDEPVIGFMADTLNATAESEWHVKSSAAIVYNASESSSNDIQIIAQAFMKDLESRQLNLDYSISFTGETFNANGRSGYYYRVDNGNLLAKESNCTRVYEGNVSGQWHVGCSPYIIEGDISIPEGETLTIDPGVWVKFMDRYPITVMGTVLAEGENTNSGDIVFTAVNPDIGWGGFDIGAIGNPELVVFNNCIFEYGSAYGEEGLNNGGAIAVGDFDNLTINNCIFQNNKAEIEMGGYSPCGGAILLVNSSPVISNSKFINNYAEYLGGAILCHDGSNPDISHCLFYNNVAGEDGGAIEIWSSNPIFTNNTFSLNTAENWGGAVDIYNVSQPDFINCIFWGNTASQYKQVSVYSNDCIVDINYCDVMAGEAGIGPYGVGSGGTYENNINEDPEFAEILAWNFHLSNASPCINTGDPEILDPDGTISDIGVFYFSIPSAPIALEGEQISNISFYATWEFDFEVSGYMLDVAADEEFETLIPGYDNLDVGATHYCEVTVPVSSIYYYRVRAYNSAGASEYSNVIMVDLAVGKEESSFESLSGFYVVPNPIKNIGEITFILQDDSEIQIEVFNYTGQKVLIMDTQKLQEGLVNIPVDFSQLPLGSYVCKIISVKSIYSTKFIKY